MKYTSNGSTEKIWRYFEEICKIPRPSKSEDRIIRYVYDFGKRNHLETETDRTGNLLIRKPASPGMEKAKTLILQSHFDMVGEKDPSSRHDFSKDPIVPVRDGDWIRASGTTLGADDGIGIAVQMCILEDRDLVHGPLECLFTVDEESGMTGAMNLRPGFLSGKILVNLDSEDEGELFIGCAGGIDTVGSFRFDPVDQPEDSSLAFRVVLEGLKGGHSGDEIHIPHGNPIKILSRFLLESTRRFGIRLSCLDGGNMRNAIPRDAYALLTVPREKAGAFEHFYKEFGDKTREELKTHEPDLKLELESANIPSRVIPQQSQIRFLEAIDCCPHGVIAWSETLEGLVETSTNLASVKFLQENRAEIITSQRSSVKAARMEIADRVKTCLEDGGGEVEHSQGYPGWTPNPKSEILRITKGAYRDLFGEEPVVRAIHAGLECGLFLEKYPELDMLSIGPTIKGAHTPNERIHIGSTGKFWKLLLEVLRRVAES